MTEKELLAYAAKAAGVNGRYSEQWGGFLIPVPVYSEEDGLLYWNPRTQDTDAFSLMVRLGLDLKVDLPNRYASVHHLSSGVLIDIKLSGDLTDSTAAVREAIFQAAVAIGKAMP